MSYDTSSLQTWNQSLPTPTQQQVLDVLTTQCQQLSVGVTKRKAGRPLSLQPMALCLAIVLCLLRGWHHQRDVWRVLLLERLAGLAPCSVSDQAVYNRLATAAPMMQNCFERISASLRSQLDGWHDRSLAPFASEVYALDESTLDQVARWLPGLRPLAKGASDLLAGRLSALFDVRRQQWVRVDLLQEAVVNCKVQARAMLAGLSPGCLLLFDRGYFSFEWFDQVQEAGLWWVSRYANNASFQVLHTCYQGDGVLDVIGWLGIHRSDQARYPVRLVQFWYQGQQYRYLSNVLDPRVLSIEQIAQLYARRWDVEMAFRLLKESLHVGVLWSAKWSVIQVQLWAALLLGQLFHGLQMQLAVEAGVDPFDISMPLLVKLTPAFLARGEAPLASLVRLGREIGVIRPSCRIPVQGPFVDVLWIHPPPAEVLLPRQHVRHAHRKCGPRSRST